MTKGRMIAELERRARRNRFQLFSRLFARIVRPERTTRILDVGGTWAYWKLMDWSALGNVEVVLFNMADQEQPPAPFTAVEGDARDLSRYDTHAFDVVHSNSTIGHVGGLLDQARMASEIRRVGKRYFVQTPNHRFIVDWRTLVPCFHFLPVSYQAWCFRHFPVGTYPRVNDRAASLDLAGRVRNLTSGELKQLFPGGTIVAERMMGLTKSFIVHSGFMVSDRMDS